MGTSAVKTAAKRSELVDQVADQLLERGLQGLSLRPLAAALGTSDRMLLHYFPDKEALVGAALDRVSERLLQATRAAAPEPRPFAAVAAELGGLFRGPRIKPYFRVWLDLASIAASGETAYAAQAAAIGKAFRDWLSSSILHPSPRRREALAALAMAALDGCALFDALGLEGVADEAMEGLGILAGEE